MLNEYGEKRIWIYRFFFRWFLKKNFSPLFLLQVLGKKKFSRLVDGKTKFRWKVKSQASQEFGEIRYC